MKKQKNVSRIMLALIVLYFSLLFGAISAFSQSPGKPKEITRTIKTKIPDTCKVYTGARGGKYVFLLSKKSGKIYKYYLPKNK